MEKALIILNNIRKTDSDILALFVFGSFVSHQTSSQNYKEIRVFDHDEYLFSRFKLICVKPDIDVLCISNNPKKTEKIIRKCASLQETYFLTINIMSKDIFEREIFSDQPKAIKLILLFRELLIIKGKEYLDSLKKQIININRPIDKIFQDEYDFRKDYQKLFAKYKIDSFSISREKHEKLFPNFLKFITGQMDCGFPDERIKVVLPKPANLKNKIDISDSNLETLL